MKIQRPKKIIIITEKKYLLKVLKKRLMKAKANIENKTNLVEVDLEDLA